MLTILLSVLLCLTANAAEPADDLADPAVAIIDYWPDEQVLDPEPADEFGVMPYASISPSYGVGTTNINLFGGVAAKLKHWEHYVYYRESQYVYVLVYGSELRYDGTRFYSDHVTVVRYNSNTGSSGTQATWSVAASTGFALQPGQYLVWSDLGDYPTLYERGTQDYVQTVCIILSSFALYYLFHHLWGDIRQRYLDA